MFGGAWRLGRIAGVEIRIDSSWIFIALLITYSLYLRFSEAFPELEVAPGVALGVGFGLLFFASVLAHEMAHAVVARARRIPVRGITLFMFGGATQARVESRGPWDEFLISVVGPASSVVLGGGFFLVGTLGRDVLPAPVSGGFSARWCGEPPEASTGRPGWPRPWGRRSATSWWPEGWRRPWQGERSAG